MPGPKSISSLYAGLRASGNASADKIVPTRMSTPRNVAKSISGAAGGGGGRVKRNGGGRVRQGHESSACGAGPFVRLCLKLHERRARGLFHFQYDRVHG